jgi:hypothetical protein
VGLAVGAGLREREMAVRQRADLARWSDRLAFRSLVVACDAVAIHAHDLVEAAEFELLQ